MDLVFAKSVHLIALAFLFWACAMKNRVLASGPLEPEQVVRLRNFDKLSGATTGLIILSGLAMVLWVAKPTTYYVGSTTFWSKMALLGVASALVIVTKIAFLHAARGAPAPWLPPRHIRAIMAFELAGLVMLAILGRVIATGG